MRLYRRELRRRILKVSVLSAIPYDRVIYPLRKYILFERKALYLQTMSDITNNTESRVQARLHRNLRSAILASRRTPDTGQIARHRRALRRHSLNVTRRAAADSTSHELTVIRYHFSSLRTQPSRHHLGIYDFNAPDLHILRTSCFRYPLLNDPKKLTCKHCGSQLWWEERSLNCCEIWRRSNSTSSPCKRLHLASLQFRRISTYQRKYNGLFSFTALGAGGCERRTWTKS